MKKRIKIFVLLAIMIIPVSLSVAGNDHVAKHPKHKKSHKHYRNTKRINPSIQGPSWR